MIKVSVRTIASRVGGFSTQLTVALVFLAAWQLLAGHLFPVLYTSTPTGVVRRFFQLIREGILLPNAETTFAQAGVGFITGAVAGIIIGNLMGLIRILAKVASPFVTFFYTVPRIAIAPLFVIWLGIGFQFKAVFVAFVVVFLFITATYAGVRDLDQDVIDGIRVMGARRWTVIRMAVLPQEVLWITTTVRLALPTAVATEVVAEFVAANRGLGFLMNSAAQILDTASLLAEVFFISISVTLIVGIMTIIERRWFRWRPTFQR